MSLHLRSADQLVLSLEICWTCRALPSSLLLLSRAFTVTQPLESPSEDAPFDSLKETISSLPNKVRGIGIILASCGYGAQELKFVPSFVIKPAGRAKLVV